MQQNQQFQVWEMLVGSLLFIVLFYWMYNLGHCSYRAAYRKLLNNKKLFRCVFCFWKVGRQNIQFLVENYV